MKVYMTVDKNGVDGFNVGEEDKSFRKLRAEANRWRGMEYWEIDMETEEFKDMVKMAKEGEWKEMFDYVVELKKRQEEELYAD